MTLTQAVFGFALLAAVVTVTPGLDTVLVLRQALRGGRRTAFAAAAGICSGALLWGMAAAAGLAALFVASQTAYAVLRWAGVAFLLYLGYGYLRSAARGGLPHTDLSTAASTWIHRSSVSSRGKPGMAVDLAADSAREAFVKGLLTDLLNPKMAVFYLTVLPLFLPSGHAPVVVGSLLAGVHALMAFGWFTVVTLGAHAIRRFLDTRRGARVIDGAAGLAMVGFGVALGLER